MDSRGPVVRNPQKIQTFLTPEKIDEMLAQYATGEGVKTLAQEYGVHRNTIWRYAVKRGIVCGQAAVRQARPEQHDRHNRHRRDDPGSRRPQRGYSDDLLSGIHLRSDGFHIKKIALTPATGATRR